MAAGEYVSVSSQADIEASDLAREKAELETMPEAELKELAQIYVSRGLTPELAQEVAIQLTAHDALGTHARDELSINEITQAKPLLAALASALAFITGGVLPLLVSVFAPLNDMVYYQYGFSIVFLALSGALAARTGGSDTLKSIIRICVWGTLAMGMSALVGNMFDINVG